MRILFLAHRLPYPPNKGDKLRSFWELQTLARCHEVDLFCFYDDADDVQYFDAVRRHCRRLYAEPVSWWGSRGRALAAAVTGRSFTLSYFYSPDMAGQVSQALRTENYDAIFVYSSSMAQYAEQAKIPQILDMADVDSDKWAQYASRFAGPKSWLWLREARTLAAYENRIATEFAATLLCTPAEAAILKRRVASARIGVLTHSVDADYYDPFATPLPPELAAWQPYVVFTGSMDYLPNADAAEFFCREIFPDLRRHVPSLQFVIAGRNPARAVKKLAEDPAVHVTGAVPDIRPYLRAAAAAVVPVRIARGVQNKILEAMAMGLPVATTSKVAAALPEAVQAKLIIEDDPRRFAACLAEQLQRGPRPPVEEIRRSFAEHFSHAALAGQLEQVLQAVVAAASGCAGGARQGLVVKGEPVAGVQRL